MTDDRDRPAQPGDDGPGVAQRLAAALRPFVGGDLPVRLTAWDGSVAGPDDAPAVRPRRRTPSAGCCWHPGELGAAQAYVTGEIDVEGDLDAALTHVWDVVRERGLSGVRPTPAPWRTLLRDGRATSAGSGRRRHRRAPRPGSGAGCTAAAATGSRSATTTTSPTSSTR